VWLVQESHGPFPPTAHRAAQQQHDPKRCRTVDFVSGYSFIAD
jgi:hypothetical protein